MIGAEREWRRHASVDIDAPKKRSLKRIELV